MSVNWASTEIIITLVCLILSCFLFIYHTFNELFRKAAPDKPLRIRLKNLTPNAKMCLSYFVLSITYNLCTLGTYALAQTPLDCLVWEFAADSFIIVRNALLFTYYALRLNAVFVKQKRLIFVSFTGTFIVQLGLNLVLMIMRYAEINTAEEHPDRICTVVYTMPHIILILYLVTLILPILISNVLFTYKLIKVIRSLPQNTSSLTYLKNSSGGTDLLNIIMAFFSLLTSGLNSVPGAAQVANMLLTFIFHFSMVGKTGGDKAPVNGGNGVTAQLNTSTTNVAKASSSLNQSANNLTTSRTRLK